MGVRASAWAKVKVRVRVRCLFTRSDKLIAVLVHALSPIQSICCPFCNLIFAKGTSTCPIHSINFRDCEGVEPPIGVTAKLGLGLGLDVLSPTCKDLYSA